MERILLEKACRLRKKNVPPSGPPAMAVTYCLNWNFVLLEFFNNCFIFVNWFYSYAGRNASLCEMESLSNMRFHGGMP
jgi:hypothetical protein